MYRVPGARMGCYLNIYVLSVMGSEGNHKVVELIEKELSVKPIEVVESKVVSNMIFVRIGCDDRDKCVAMKERIEGKLTSFPWFKTEVVCP